MATDPPESDAGSDCPECGARVPADGTCRDHFHTLLAREWDVYGGVGRDAHFLAVASYALQHPDSMGHSAGSLEAHRTALAEHLEGGRSIEDVQSRMQETFEGPSRVRAAPDESVDDWRRSMWQTTVTDVLDVGPDLAAYRDRVREWAASILLTLEETGGSERGGLERGDSGRGGSERGDGQ